MKGKRKCGKHFMLSVGMLCFFLFLCSSTVYAAAEQEDNGSFQDANRISVNSTIEGAISDRNDADFYRFDLASNGSVNLTFWHEIASGSYSSWDHWKLTLYNFNGEVLLERGVVGNLRTTETTTVGLPSGTYYLRVVSYHSNIEAMHNNFTPYSFTVNYQASSNWEKELNNSFSSANLISLNQTIYGSNVESDDADYYQFTVAENGHLSIQFQHPYESSYGSWGHWKATIYNYNGQVLAQEKFPGNVTSMITDSVKVSPGTYFLLVESYTSNLEAMYRSDAVYQFQLQMRNSSPSEMMEAPDLTVTNRTTSSVSLQWNRVSGAEGYTIWYRSEYESELSRKIFYSGNTTSWTQKGLQPGTKYFYTIKAWVKDDSGYTFGEQSAIRRGTTKPRAARIDSAYAIGNKIKIRLAGNAAGANMYSMCYGNSRSCFEANDFNVGIRTQYTTRTLSQSFRSGTYYVCVKSYRDLENGSRVYGAWSNTYRVVVK